MTNTETLAHVPAPAAVFAAGLLDTPPATHLIPEDRVANPDFGPHIDVVEEIEQYHRDLREWEAERYAF